MAPFVGAFFMDLKPQPAYKENISLSELKDKPVKQVEYTAPKAELSENIQRFDQKVKKKVASPYDYNSVSLSKKVDYMPSADQMITNPVYNSVGKFLGIDTLHDWSAQSDKVKMLVDWAETKTGKNDMNSIMDFLNGALNAAPSFGMNHKRIDQLYMYAKLNMGGQTKAPQRPVEQPVKTVIKKVYVKQKMTQDEMVNRLIRGV